MTMKLDSMSVVTSMLKLGVGAALALCLVQCSSEQQRTDEPESVASVQQALACGGVACSTVNDCTNAANWPLCAKIGSAQCFAAPNGCTYQLKTDPSCPCIERDVRLCNVNPTTPGVQICTANAGRTATLWGTCTACAACM
jgi:hypothetical protein